MNTVAYQSIIELSRTQDEEVGDGTTSVIILGGIPNETTCWLLGFLQGTVLSLPIHIPPTFSEQCLPVLMFSAGEMLHAAQPLLEKNLHPTVIVRGYLAALEDAVKVLKQIGDY